LTPSRRARISLRLKQIQHVRAEPAWRSKPNTAAVELNIGIGIKFGLQHFWLKFGSNLACTFGSNLACNTFSLQHIWPATQGAFLPRTQHPCKNTNPWLAMQTHFNSKEMTRFGQSHIPAYAVYLVFLALKSPSMRSYTVYILYTDLANPRDDLRW